MWSFEDEAWHGLAEEDIRHLPPNCEHSIAWIIWHIARIEDVTMNLLVAGTRQIFRRDNWLKRLKISRRDTGNAMGAQDVAKLSATRFSNSRLTADSNRGNDSRARLRGLI